MIRLYFPQKKVGDRAKNLGILPIFGPFPHV
nr:MAG TPA: alpha-N-acetylgalactosaminidase domain-containing protein [Caudoviricetes sp.]